MGYMEPCLGSRDGERAALGFLGSGKSSMGLTSSCQSYLFPVLKLVLLLGCGVWESRAKLAVLKVTPNFG